MHTIRIVLTNDRIMITVYSGVDFVSIRHASVNLYYVMNIYEQTVYRNLNLCNFLNIFHIYHI